MKLDSVLWLVQGLRGLESLYLMKPLRMVNLYEHVTSENALRPRASKPPTEPTAIERAQHNMTHLPFRSRCLVCLKAKSKSDKHKRLKLRHPLVQIDFAFWADSTWLSLPILTAIDIISTMSSASALPSKEFSNYAVTELKKFVYEVGRTYGRLHCDQENPSSLLPKQGSIILEV